MSTRKVIFDQLSATKLKDIRSFTEFADGQDPQLILTLNNIIQRTSRALDSGKEVKQFKSLENDRENAILEFELPISLDYQRLMVTIEIINAKSDGTSKGQIGYAELLLSDLLKLPKDSNGKVSIPLREGKKKNQHGFVGLRVRVEEPPVSQPVTTAPVPEPVVVPVPEPVVVPVPVPVPEPVVVPVPEPVVVPVPVPVPEPSVVSVVEPSVAAPKKDVSNISQDERPSVVNTPVNSQETRPLQNNTTPNTLSPQFISFDNISASNLRNIVGTMQRMFDKQDPQVVISIGKQTSHTARALDAEDSVQLFHDFHVKNAPAKLTFDISSVDINQSVMIEVLNMSDDGKSKGQIGYREIPLKELLTMSESGQRVTLPLYIKEKNKIKTEGELSFNLKTSQVGPTPEKLHAPNHTPSDPPVIFIPVSKPLSVTRDAMITISGIRLRDLIDTGSNFVIAKDAQDPMVTVRVGKQTFETARQVDAGTSADFPETFTVDVPVQAFNDGETIVFEAYNKSKIGSATSLGSTVAVPLRFMVDTLSTLTVVQLPLEPSKACPKAKGHVGFTLAVAEKPQVEETTPPVIFIPVSKPLSVTRDAMITISGIRLRDLIDTGSNFVIAKDAQDPMVTVRVGKQTFETARQVDAGTSADFPETFTVDVPVQAFNDGETIVFEAYNKSKIGSATSLGSTVAVPLRFMVDTLSTLTVVQLPLEPSKACPKAKGHVGFTLAVAEKPQVEETTPPVIFIPVSKPLSVTRDAMITISGIRLRDLIDTGSNFVIAKDAQDPMVTVRVGKQTFETARQVDAGTSADFPETFTVDVPVQAFNDGETIVFEAYNKSKIGSATSLGSTVAVPLRFMVDTLSTLTVVQLPLEPSKACPKAKGHVGFTLAVAEKPQVEETTPPVIFIPVSKPLSVTRDAMITISGIRLRDLIDTGSNFVIAKDAQDPMVTVRVGKQTFETARQVDAGTSADFPETFTVDVPVQAFNDGETIVFEAYNKSKIGSATSLGSTVAVPLRFMVDTLSTLTVVQLPLEPSKACPKAKGHVGFTLAVAEKPQVEETTPPVIFIPVSKPLSVTRDAMITISGIRLRDLIDTGSNFVIAKDAQDPMVTVRVGKQTFETARQVDAGTSADFPETFTVDVPVQAFNDGETIVFEAYNKSKIGSATSLGSTVAVPLRFMVDTLSTLTVVQLPLEPSKACPKAKGHVGFTLAVAEKPQVEETTPPVIFIPVSKPLSVTRDAMITISGIRLRDLIDTGSNFVIAKDAQDPMVTVRVGKQTFETARQVDAGTSADFPETFTVDVPVQAFNDGETIVFEAYNKSKIGSATSLGSTVAVPLRFMVDTLSTLTVVQLPLEPSKACPKAKGHVGFTLAVAEKPQVEETTPPVIFIPVSKPLSVTRDAMITISGIRLRDLIDTGSNFVIAKDAQDPMVTVRVGKQTFETARQVDAGTSADFPETFTVDVPVQAFNDGETIVFEAYNKSKIGSATSLGSTVAVPLRFMVDTLSTLTVVQLPLEPSKACPKAKGHVGFTLAVAEKPQVEVAEAVSSALFSPVSKPLSVTRDAMITISGIRLRDLIDTGSNFVIAKDAQDPMVTVRVGKQTFETARQVDAGTSADFPETFTVDVPVQAFNDGETIVFEAYNKSKIGSATSLGSTVAVPLRQLVDTVGTEFSHTLELMPSKACPKAKGRLRFAIAINEKPANAELALSPSDMLRILVTGMRVNGTCGQERSLCVRLCGKTIKKATSRSTELYTVSDKGLIYFGETLEYYSSVAEFNEGAQLEVEVYSSPTLLSSKPSNGNGSCELRKVFKSLTGPGEHIQLNLKNNICVEFDVLVTPKSVVEKTALPLTPVELEDASSIMKDMVRVSLCEAEIKDARNVELLPTDKNDLFLKLEIPQRWKYTTTVQNGSGDNAKWFYDGMNDRQLSFESTVKQLCGMEMKVWVMDKNSMSDDKLIGVGVLTLLDSWVVAERNAPLRVKLSIPLTENDASEKSAGTVSLRFQVSEAPPVDLASRPQRNAAEAEAAAAAAGLVANETFIAGTVRVRRVECDGLAAVEYQGDNDPFVKLDLGTHGSYTTEPLEDAGSYALFDHLAASFAVNRDILHNELLQITVKDRNSFRKDVLIGKASTSLKILLFTTPSSAASGSRLVASDSISETVLASAELIVELENEKHEPAGRVRLFVELEAADVDAEKRIEETLQQFPATGGELRVVRARLVEVPGIVNSKVSFGLRIDGGEEHTTSIRDLEVAPLAVFDRLDWNLPITAAQLRNGVLSGTVRCHRMLGMSVATIGSGDVQMRFVASRGSKGAHIEITIPLQSSSKSAGRVVLTVALLDIDAIAAVKGTLEMDSRFSSGLLRLDSVLITALRSIELLGRSDPYVIIRTPDISELTRHQLTNETQLSKDGCWLSRTATAENCGDDVVWRHLGWQIPGLSRELVSSGQVYVEVWEDNITGDIQIGSAAMSMRYFAAKMDTSAECNVDIFSKNGEKIVGKVTLRGWLTENSFDELNKQYSGDISIEASSGGFLVVESMIGRELQGGGILSGLKSPFVEFEVSHRDDNLFKRQTREATGLVHNSVVPTHAWEALAWETPVIPASNLPNAELRVTLWDGKTKLAQSTIPKALCILSHRMSRMTELVFLFPAKKGSKQGTLTVNVVMKPGDQIVNSRESQLAAAESGADALLKPAFVDGLFHLQSLKLTGLANRELIGAADPYAIVRLGLWEDETSPLMDAGTEVQWTNLNWSTPVTAEALLAESAAGRLVVDVMDKNTSRRDAHIGSASLSLKRCVLTSGSSGLTGEPIQLTATLTDNEKKRVGKVEVSVFCLGLAEGNERPKLPSDITEAEINIHSVAISGVNADDEIGVSLSLLSNEEAMDILLSSSPDDQKHNRNKKSSNATLVGLDTFLVETETVKASTSGDAMFDALTGGTGVLSNGILSSAYLRIDLWEPKSSLVGSKKEKVGVGLIALSSLTSLGPSTSVRVSLRDGVYRTAVAVVNWSLQKPRAVASLRQPDDDVYEIDTDTQNSLKAYVGGELLISGISAQGLPSKLVAQILKRQPVVRFIIEKSPIVKGTSKSAKKNDSSIEWTTVTAPAPTESGSAISGGAGLIWRAIDICTNISPNSLSESVLRAQMWLPPITGNDVTKGDLIASGVYRLSRLATKLDHEAHKVEVSLRGGPDHLPSGFLTLRLRLASMFPPGQSLPANFAPTRLTFRRIVSIGLKNTELVGQADPYLTLHLQKPGDKSAIWSDQTTTAEDGGSDIVWEPVGMFCDILDTDMADLPIKIEAWDRNTTRGDVLIGIANMSLLQPLLTRGRICESRVMVIDNDGKNAGKFVITTFADDAPPEVTAAGGDGPDVDIAISRGGCLAVHRASVRGLPERAALGMRKTAPHLRFSLVNIEGNSLPLSATARGWKAKTSTSSGAGGATDWEALDLSTGSLSGEDFAGSCLQVEARDGDSLLASGVLPLRQLAFKQPQEVSLRLTPSESVSKKKSGSSNVIRTALLISFDPNEVVKEVLVPATIDKGGQVAIDLVSASKLCNTASPTSNRRYWRFRLGGSEATSVSIVSKTADPQWPSLNDKLDVSADNLTRNSLSIGLFEETDTTNHGANDTQIAATKLPLTTAVLRGAATTTLSGSLNSADGGLCGEVHLNVRILSGLSDGAVEGLPTTSVISPGGEMRVTNISVKEFQPLTTDVGVLSGAFRSVFGGNDQSPGVMVLLRLGDWMGETNVTNLSADGSAHWETSLSVNTSPPVLRDGRLTVSLHPPAPQKKGAENNNKAKALQQHSLGITSLSLRRFGAVPLDSPVTVDLPIRDPRGRVIGFLALTAIISTPLPVPVAEPTPVTVVPVQEPIEAEVLVNKATAAAEAAAKKSSNEASAAVSAILASRLADMESTLAERLTAAAASEHAATMAAVTAQTEELQRAIRRLDRSLREAQTSAPPPGDVSASTVTQTSPSVILPKDIRKWRAFHVQAWLAFDVELPQYIDSWSAAAIDGRVILSGESVLTDHTLRDSLGMSDPLHVAKVQLAMEALRRKHAKKMLDEEKAAAEKAAALARAQKLAAEKKKTAPKKKTKRLSSSQPITRTPANTTVGDGSNGLARVRLERALRDAAQQQTAAATKKRSSTQTWNFEYSGQTAPPGDSATTDIWQTLSSSLKPSEKGTHAYQEMITKELAADINSPAAKSIQVVPPNTSTDGVITLLRSAFTSYARNLVELEKRQRTIADAEENELEEELMSSLRNKMGDALLQSSDNKEREILPINEESQEVSPRLDEEPEVEACEQALPSDNEDDVPSYDDLFPDLGSPTAPLPTAPSPSKKLDSFDTDNASALRITSAPRVRRDLATHLLRASTLASPVHKETQPMDGAALVFRALISQTNNGASWLGTNEKLTRLKLSGGLESLLRLRISWSQFDALWQRLDRRHVGDVDLSDFRALFGSLTPVLSNDAQHSDPTDISIQEEKIALSRLLFRLCDTLRSSGLSVSEMFACFDRNGSGEVSTSEFLSLLRSALGPGAFDRRVVFRALSSLDIDGDGNISRHELSAFVYRVWRAQLDALATTIHLLTSESSGSVAPGSRIEELLDGLLKERAALKDAVKRNFPRAWRDALERDGLAIRGPFCALLEQMSVPPPPGCDELVIAAPATFVPVEPELNSTQDISIVKSTIPHRPNSAVNRNHRGRSLAASGSNQLLRFRIRPPTVARESAVNSIADLNNNPTIDAAGNTRRILNSHL